ncbi:TIGR03617 family F420-dependent LLM class oxidoreductase [Kutzneria chonburiensis]|uniref:TIGR03617 family F420-dependent LLM class oxidoreductase n=1 Tax=Kutzneria chonburiensis TaxID=1483604 RepID=A0ABV6MSM4_9PSEU|nr:TIGR03617 family F420-dependent LLM class oxidoreductase [Kutzneria chonburiensis]
MVRIDTGDMMAGPRDIGAAARRVEAAGFDGVWIAEAQHDPFVLAALAAQATTTLKVQTIVAIAFARNPMSMAVAANDTQLVSAGRFTLGLACGVESQIRHRYGMPWSRPAARIREYVLAVRAIWTAFRTGTQPDFRGDFFTHTELPPFFDPGPNPYGYPDINLSGVGRRMAEVAGEVADGFLCHNFMTERYLREVTLPALARGRARAGKTMAGFRIGPPSFLVTGADEASFQRSKDMVKQEIAFYAATASYRPVLELHGWDSLADEAVKLAADGRLDLLGPSIDDEMLAAFAIVAEPDHVADRIKARFGDIATQIIVPMPAEGHDTWSGVLAALR